METELSTSKLRFLSTVWSVHWATQTKTKCPMKCAQMIAHRGTKHTDKHVFWTITESVKTATKI